MITKSQVPADQYQTFAENISESKTKRQKKTITLSDIH